MSTVIFRPARLLPTCNSELVLYVSDKCDLPAGCKIQDYIVQDNFDSSSVNTRFNMYITLWLPCVRLTVCLSVCLSVCRRYHFIGARTLAIFGFWVWDKSDFSVGL